MALNIENRPYAGLFKAYFDFYQNMHGFSTLTGQNQASHFDNDLPGNVPLFNQRNARLKKSR